MECYSDFFKQWLNEQLKSIDPDFHTALHHAAARGKLRQVVLLLECGASVTRQDSYGATPMHYAAVHGFYATLRLLYKANKYTDVSFYIHRKMQSSQLDQGFLF